MRCFPLVCSLLLTIGGVCQAQESSPANWGDLIQGGKCKEARALCTPWLTSKDVTKQVEGHKCLANVELCEDEGVVAIERNDAGGGVMAGTYKPEAVNRALYHLEEALKLAPQDLSIHQGRLHVLEISFRYAEMVKALDESCTLYQGSEGAEPWLGYIPELADQKQYRAALALLEVMDRHYPNSHEVLGNLGAIHSMLEEEDLAIPYLRRAVELAPGDPIDAWDLGRAYDYAGKIELADEWYQKGMALDTDPERLKENRCIYAEFVEKKLHDRKRACALEKANCPAGEQKACVAK